MTGVQTCALPILHRSHVYMDPDSVLVLYTDGLIERTNANEEQFGVERLKKLVRENQTKSPEKIAELIYSTVHAYGNARNWEDDVTLVVIKRK